MAGCLSHDHDCAELACAGGSLYKFINHASVRCLNAAEGSEAAAVLRPWEARHERESVLESNEDDCELLLFIPFTHDVRLTGIVVAGDGDSAPSRLRVWTNREDIDFQLAAELPPLQEWQLGEDPTASLEYPTRASRFTVVSSLTMHFPANGGASTTRLHFVGLRGAGDLSKSRELATNVVYESSARPADHKASSSSAPLSRLGH